MLGAQALRPVDLATFYATIANEGLRPSPYAIETLEQDGNVVYRHEPSSVPTGSADRVSFYQLKSMLQGVLQHGTARRIEHLAPYVAGKTGTTDDENDAWFIGFTNAVTVAIWVGYDNANGKRRTLGSGQTGASVAAPIFEPFTFFERNHKMQKAPVEGALFVVMEKTASGSHVNIFQKNSERSTDLAINHLPTPSSVYGGTFKMIGKITLAAALLAGTAAFAQQTPPPSASPNAPTPQMQNQNQCWDIATNQVRDKQQGTVGAGQQTPPGGARPSSPPAQSNPGAAGSAAQRPAGMQNC